MDGDAINQYWCLRLSVLVFKFILVEIGGTISPLDGRI